MTLPSAKFPRRHTQRQALRQRNKASIGKASIGNLQSQEQRQRHKSRNTRHRHIDSDSESNSDVDVDTDREQEDSGYDSNGDDEAKYLNELVEQFREMGPQISNLGDVTQEMIQTERRMFQK
jgi:hypothetical protein